MKEEMWEIKKQNNILKATCCNYKDSLRSQQKQVQDGEDKAENGMGESKLEELRNAKKQVKEKEKVKFSESKEEVVVRNKIQEKTKDTVI
ncbi:hypothetical protein E2C01_056117 [Portunus trituberculatus]|uniref:Uncharacterized protein n=1 Tax=Portunus trituberculatus TaxID=210409 RepID=A0A5B7GY27_PORTR|nr:hypothetical protein [Portunus trituberculatus]